MDSQTQSQVQKKQILEGDLRLLEKKIKDTTIELEQLQSSKTNAFKEHDIQIRKKQDLLVTLENRELEVVQTLKEYDEAIFEAEEIRELTVHSTMEMLSDAQGKVTALHEEVKKADNAVKDREIDISEREEVCVLALDTVEGLLEEISIKESDQERRDIILTGRKNYLDKQEEESKITLAQRQELLDDIDRQLLEKRTEIKTLDIQIADKTKEAESIVAEAADLLEKVKLRESVVAGREIGVNEKNEEIIRRQNYVNDKSKTIHRAYRELLQRGGTIANG